MKYFVMRKNEYITSADFSEDGRMLSFDKEIANKEIAPLQNRTDSNWLVKWWENRSVPIGQGKLEEMLKQKNIACPEEYLLKNLGLSLNDYYWIKPENSPLRWEDVNLFQNKFRNELQIEKIRDVEEYSQYNPNSSLQGQLEKKWMLHDDVRYLVKGNRDEYSAESMNEVIASQLHKRQGYDNYTDYTLIKIKGADYNWGCISECFTDEHKELVSAYDVVTSEKQPNDISSYEFFIKLCGKQGVDEEQLRRDMEYQIMTDFILSGRDRHLNNVGVLRDAETLRFIRMAPIFDSGKCLFVNEAIPYSTKELLNIQTTSFAKNELKLLSYIHDPFLVDVSKLPGPELIWEIYQKDSKMDEKRIAHICEAYEKKVDLFRDFQLGKDLNRMKFSLSQTQKTVSGNEYEWEQ